MEVLEKIQCFSYKYKSKCKGKGESNPQRTDLEPGELGLGFVSAIYKPTPPGLHFPICAVGTAMPMSWQWSEVYRSPFEAASLCASQGLTKGQP